jgi:hypothetical protein
METRNELLYVAEDPAYPLAPHFKLLLNIGIYPTIYNLKYDFDMYSPYKSAVAHWYLYDVDNTQ